MVKTLGELTEIANGRLTGDPGLLIHGVAALDEAGEHDITFLVKDRYRTLLEKTKAAAAVVPVGFKTQRCATIESKNPDLAFARISASLIEKQKPSPSIHPSAFLEKGVVLGKDVTISAFCYVGERSILKDGVVLFPHVTIGSDCEIGEQSILYPAVVVREKTILGKKVMLHAGVVIGSDGFGYAKEEKGPFKIPQVGRVIIEDDVELGANTTVDRATLGVTKIKRGTKLDNLVHIGHNTVVGENCLFAAQTGISGSVIVEDGVVIGGQAGVADHLTIGNGSRVGAQAGVIKDVEAGSTVSGYPARSHREALKLLAYLEKIPELHQEVKIIKKKLAELERKKR